MRQDIEHRLVPGHWKGDFIKGAFNRSAIGTLVERKTRFVILCRMDGCTARDATEGFTRQMKRLPAFLRQSLTYDRGSEMACHADLSKRLKLDVWFCDPHAPWQRGSNENTNGLLRQYGRLVLHLILETAHSIRALVFEEQHALSEPLLRDRLVQDYDYRESINLIRRIVGLPVT